MEGGELVALPTLQHQPQGKILASLHIISCLIPNTLWQDPSYCFKNFVGVALTSYMSVSLTGELDHSLFGLCAICSFS